ncbi:flagellar basal body-associated FliL family protein [Thioclava atlantica]|uniref:Flagellar basal body-associated protein FliL n=1 Tax=Thioclava atlantica TaxID=1317124 RepID=A0A085TVK2_9RHOB|nr:flagellar basal body-associated FliL family protein [Thioclava atlantica]KFE34749.1 flagellar basal body-associated protein FliL [Thioclava atlantica]
MLGKILPLILALIGLGAGGAAGYFLRPPPAPEEEIAECAPPKAEEPAHGDAAEDEATTSEFVKLNNQFIVPIVDEGRVSALVILSLNIEVRVGETESVYRAEPKLRDGFLQVLFDHANVGGFDGLFTGTANMDLLRRALTETARDILGPSVIAVLVSDIVRQDG